MKTLPKHHDPKINNNNNDNNRYPEIPTNIMIDGTAIHAAAAHGFGQLVFAGDCVIFHQV